MWINRPESTEVSLVEASVKPPNATAVDLEERSLVLDIESMSRQSNLEALKLVQLQSEIGDIEEQIDAVKSNRLAGIDYQLGVDECTSLTIAAAAQSAILSGVSLEYLRNDLEESTHRFPETRGSALAAQLLASTAVQN